MVHPWTPLLLQASVPAPQAPPSAAVQGPVGVMRQNWAPLQDDAPQGVVKAEASAAIDASWDTKASFPENVASVPPPDEHAAKSKRGA
jgi:hypothetical protein